MTDNLDSLPDSELNQLFAVEVECCTRVAPAQWVRDAKRRIWGSRPGESFRFPLPEYCTDANAVLPWLGTDWDVRARNGSHVRVTYYRPSEQIEGEANNGSFARAAVIALIRARRAGK